MFIAVDPGKNVGVATFAEDGSDITRAVFRLNDFYKFLKYHHKFALKEDEKIRWIVEDFKLRKDKALDQVGSEMPAPMAIGAIELMHTMLGEKSFLNYQHSNVLHTALKWSGYANYANSNRHPPDDIAAYAHGVFWLIQNNVRKHPIFNEN